MPFFLERLLKPFLRDGKVKKSLELRQQALLQLKALQKKSPSLSSPLSTSVSTSTSASSSTSASNSSSSASKALSWVWFHCASGEVEYAKPLLRSLQQEGKVRVLLTYFSPSLLPLLEREKTKLAEMLLPLPWDRPYPMALLLKVFSPKALLLAHKDLWPEMLYQAKRAGVPILYFSVHCPSLSSKGLSFFKKIVWNFFSRLLTEVHCIEEEDRQRLQKSFPFLKVETGGNTRVDEMLYKQKEKRNSPKLKELFPLFSPCEEKKELVFVAGSTWPRDEAFFLFLAQHYFQKGFQKERHPSQGSHPVQAPPQFLRHPPPPSSLQPLRTLGPVRWVLVPHDPSPKRLEAILRRCQELHLKTILYHQVKNQGARAWQREAILVVDHVGLLAKMYQFGHLALVGGGLSSGAHSLLEPFAWGLPLLVGPHCQNQPEFRWMQRIFLPPTLSSPSPSSSSSPSSSPSPSPFSSSSPPSSSSPSPFPSSSLKALKALNVFSSFQEGRSLFIQLLSVLEREEQGTLIRKTLQDAWKGQAGASTKALKWLERQLNDS